MARERAIFWEQAKAMTPYVALEHRQSVFLLPTDIDVKTFAAVGRPEFAVLERACSVLRAEGRLLERGGIVDVGAHIGTTTISAIANEDFAWGVAIEPDPTHVPLLRANLVLNKLDDRVQVVQAAMAGAAKAGQSFSPGSRKADSYRWMKGRLVEEAEPGSVTIDTVTVDGLAEAGVIDPEATALLWFDCSRCEEHALPAATRFLERRVPLVFPVLRGQFARTSRLLELLRKNYEHVVDLRSPLLTIPLSDWTPSIRRLDDIVDLPREEKKLSDVLVF